MLGIETSLQGPRLTLGPLILNVWVSVDHIFRARRLNKTNGISRALSTSRSIYTIFPLSKHNLDAEQCPLYLESWRTVCLSTQWSSDSVIVGRSNSLLERELGWPTNNGRCLSVCRQSSAVRQTSKASCWLLHYTPTHLLYCNGVLISEFSISS